MVENVHYCLELLVSRSNDLVQASDHNHSYYRWKRLDYLIYGTFEFLCSLLVEDNHLELHSWVCYKTLVGNKLVPQREQLHLKYCLGQDKRFYFFLLLRTCHLKWDILMWKHDVEEDSGVLV